MLHVEQFIIDGGATVLDAMKKLDETGERILFLAPGGVLEAALTDGDLRKHILRGGALEDPVRRAANPAPKSLPLTERGRAKRYIEQYDIDALPLVDKKGRIADIIFASGAGVANRACAGIPVVIRAGGLGGRR